MKFKEFILRQMSENGEPSNNRVMAFLFMSTVVLMLLAAVFSPIFNVPVVKLPEIPESFADFVKWVLGILITGTAAGKLVNAYKEKGTPNATSGTDQPTN